LPDGLQQLQMLSDVTDFKIQLYLFDNSPTQKRWRWFPDDQDMKMMADYSNTFMGSSGPDPLIPFALYWNVPDLNYTTDPTMALPTWILSASSKYDSIPWWHETDTLLSDPTGSSGIFLTTWPKAIRFTFTLYDKSRQRFPDGQTFSYIVKMPARY